MSKLSPKKLREQLGLSPDEMARALGVTAITIARWEAGSVVPQGIAQEVLRGIEQAVAEGGDARRIAGKLALGVAAVIYHQLSGSVPTELPR